MSDAEPEGLARFGIAPKTVLREPTQDRHEPMNVCAECGAPADGPSTFLAHHPTLAREIVADGPHDDPPMSDVLDAALEHLIQSEQNIQDARGEVDPETIQRFNTDVLALHYRTYVDSR